MATAWPGRRSAITVLDVVEAIDGAEPAFRCTEIRRRGPTAQPASAYRLACGIHRAMDAADAAWRDSLRGVTVAELVDGVMKEASPAALAAGAALDRGGDRMKVFLTGATGVAGRATVPALLAAGHDVRAVSRRAGGVGRARGGRG